MLDTKRMFRSAVQALDMRKLLAGRSAFSLLAVAATLATLVLLPAWDAVLHLNGRFRSWDYWGTLVGGTIGLTLTFALLLLAIQRVRPALIPASLVLAAAVFLFGSDAVDSIVAPIDLPSGIVDLLPTSETPLQILGTILLAAAALGLIVRPRQAGSLLFGAMQVLSPLPVVLATQLGWSIITDSKSLASAATPPPNVERTVVWIVFDELDKEMLNRNLGKLPAFRSLMDRALVADNAYPPANMTLDSIPAMLLGSPLSGSDIRRDGLVFRKWSWEPWTRMTESDNALRSLSRQGYGVSVTGWHLPYCNSFPESTNCLDDTPNVTPGEEVGLWSWIFVSNWLVKRVSNAYRNMLAVDPERYGNFIFDKLPWSMEDPKRFEDALFQNLPWMFRHARFDKMLASLEDNVNAGIQSKKYDLIFAHLPCPHLPHFERHLHSYQPRTMLHDYEANLVLCDSFLHQTLADLDAAHYANGYVLIVSSDHWFRSLDWLEQGRGHVTPTRRRSVPLMLYSSTEDDRVPHAPITHTFNTSGLGPVVKAITANQVSTYAGFKELLLRLNDHSTILRTF